MITHKTGRRVAARLATAGRPVRAASRSGETWFDWEDDATWAPALAGVGAAYIVYYPDLAFPVAADTVGAFADLAVANGVRRLVLLSGRGEEGARLGEVRVEDSGSLLRARGLVPRRVATSLERGTFGDSPQGHLPVRAGECRRDLLREISAGRVGRHVSGACVRPATLVVIRRDRGAQMSFRRSLRLGSGADTRI